MDSQLHSYDVMRVLTAIVVVGLTVNVLAADQCQSLFHSAAIQPNSLQRPIAQLNAAAAYSNPELIGRDQPYWQLVHQRFTQSDRAMWANLRKERLLVNQNSIEGVTDLCTVACSINVLQAAAVKSGLEPIPNPNAIFEKFVRNNVQLGSADISTTVTRLRQLLLSRFKDKAPEVSAVVIKGLDEDPNLVTEVNSITVADLKPENQKLKLTFAVQYNRFGKMVLQHSQIVESIEGDVVRLVEPNAPYVDISGRLDGTTIVSGQSVPLVIYQDGKMAGLDSFSVFGVITIDLSKHHN